MTTLPPVSSPAPAAGAAPAKRLLAPASSPVTDALIPAGGDVPMGAGTSLRKVLAEQLRYRVTREGGRFEIAPDSAIAAALVGTPPGERLERILSVAADSAEGFPDDKVNLRGFVLARDTADIAAGLMLGTLEDGISHKPDEALRQLRSRSFPVPQREWAEKHAQSMQYNARAFNMSGWTTFTPRVARELLATAGAHSFGSRVDPSTAAGIFDRVTGTTVHEVQHSVTPPDHKTEVGDARGGWIEEGIAHLLSRSPEIQSASAAAMKLTPKGVHERLNAPADVELGWGPFRPEGPKPAPPVNTQRNYYDSKDVLRGLLELSGIDMARRGGVEAARHALQDVPAGDVPGRLADSIIAEHGIDPARRQELLERVLGSIDAPDAVAAIARDFLPRRRS